ncbi:MAG: hypothetical protein AB8G95_03065 [Anaerolineae bacterium]
MDVISKRKNIAVAGIIFALLLILSILSDPWVVSAIATDDTGLAILGPPAPGEQVTVSSLYGIENVRPPVGDPIVRIGGYVLVIDKTEQPDLDESEFDSITDIEANGSESETNKQAAVLAFGTNHAPVSFGGSLSGYSNFLLETWNAEGVDTGDISFSCLNSESEITSTAVENEMVTIAAVLGADGSTVDYQFTISALIRQEGHCMIFMTSETSAKRTVNNRDNDRDALASTGV